VRCYHTTPAADAILREGFRDRTATYMTDEVFTGVWFADRMVDEGGAQGNVTLCLEIPDEVFAGHEWIEEGKQFREALIPAAVVNRYGPPTIYAWDGSEDLDRRTVNRILANESNRELADRLRAFLPLFERHGFVRENADEPEGSAEETARKEKGK
jgi:hypothetical protein